jgi:hypothetical protein
MTWLHKSKEALEGTAYFEFLPGPYCDQCWGPTSVFLDERTFGLIEPIVLAVCPKYDHYAFTEIGRPIWCDVLAELDRLVAFIDGSPTDEALRSRLRFFPRDSESAFFAKRDKSLAQLRATVQDLSRWLRATLGEHDVISLLGL